MEFKLCIDPSFSSSYMVIVPCGAVSSKMVLSIKKFSLAVKYQYFNQMKFFECAGDEYWHIFSFTARIKF